MSNAKSNKMRLPLEGGFEKISPENSIVDFARLEEKRVRIEAKRRARFVREVGNVVTGYGDGFQDGFEQAVQWLLGQLPGPFEASYRADAGMEFSKTFYLTRTKERKKLLEWFDNNCGLIAED